MPGQFYLWIRLRREGLAWFSHCMCVMAWVACLTAVSTCTGCQVGGRPTPRPQPVKPSDLLLGTQDLPEGWFSRTGVLDNSHHYPLAEAALATTFDSVGQPGVANHLIMQYRDGLLAAKEFARERAAFFSLTYGETAPWEKPGALQYKSTIADQYDCACQTEIRGDGSGELATICVAISRYDEFISVFSTWILDDNMTYSDFQQVLETIDARMARHLGKTQRDAPGTATAEP